MRAFSLAVLVSISLSPPALAGWASTTWGSTVAQVTKSMATTFPIRTPVGGKPDAQGRVYRVGEYRSGPFHFSVSYEFAGERLSGIHMYLNSGGKCAALSSSLQSKYGKPVEEDLGNPTVRVWQDTSKNNRMKLTVFTDTFCTLDYEPLRSAANAGL